MWRRLLLAAAALILACLIAGGGYALWFLHDFRRPGPLAADTVVVIPQGAPLTKALRLLEDAHVIRSARRLRKQIRWLAKGKDVQAGEYRFKAHESAREVLARLRRGDVLLYRMTIPEGWPSVRVAERLAAATEISGPTPTVQEGSVLPDTYSYQRGESRAQLLARMQHAMRRTIARLWPMRAPGLPFATPEEAVTLASIVEKETAKPSEYALVAGVYINRLRAGIPLQADPTIIYPITKGKALGRRIRLSEVRAVNGYNTYTRVGLPIGPIANPSATALRAVFNPAKTGALFFVADGTGGHVFADNLAEHERNVARWRKYRAERGI